MVLDTKKMYETFKKQLEEDIKSGAIKVFFHEQEEKCLKHREFFATAEFNKAFDALKKYNAWLDADMLDRQYGKQLTLNDLDYKDYMALHECLFEVFRDEIKTDPEEYFHTEYVIYKGIRFTQTTGQGMAFQSYPEEMHDELIKRWRE